MGGAAELRARNAWSHGRIPVLDIGPYLAGDAGAAAPLARAVASTFEDTGFLVIANHGIPPRLVEGTSGCAEARPRVGAMAQPGFSPGAFSRRGALSRFLGGSSRSVSSWR